jgi:hypothetical protein
MNYVIIGAPIIRMNEAIKTQTRSILLKQAKAGELFNNPQDEYLVNLFRKEKASNDRKVLLLNCVSASLAFVVLSWMIFGIAGRRRV